MISNRFIICVAFLLVFLIPENAIAVNEPHQNFPRRANVYLSWDLDEKRAKSLSAWDLVILDMEIQERRPELIKKMRQWNPDIVILVYITPQEIRQDAHVSYSMMRRKLVSGIDNDWYLRGTSGNKLSWWPETDLLNVTNDSPIRNGKRWNNYLVDFVVNDLLSTGLWDGVFYDNAWDNITYFANTNRIDFNGNGFKDSRPDERWRGGMRYIYNETRKRAGDIIIVGNGTTLEYKKELDGQLFENFNNFSWDYAMQRYSGNGPWSIINANTNNTGDSENYKRMRYGLTSALLSDGFYSYDFGDKSHGQIWWYDEYNVDLGIARGDATREYWNSPNFDTGLWKRDFDNGIVVVNSSEKEEKIELGVDMEKVHGSQDSVVNDGSITSEITLSPEDGIILLKPVEKLEDVRVINGDFSRFRRFDGSRVRNGLFLSDSTYDGSDTIVRTDINGNGRKDLVVATNNQLFVWRHDNQPYARFYPYSVRFSGQLQITVADINEDGKKEIIVAPNEGYTLPIKIYSYDGVLLTDNWYPVGRRYSGGYSVAVNDQNSQILVGVGKGRRAEVITYTKDLSKVRSWFAYDYSYRSGVNIATGDVNGDGINEIITGPGYGKSPIIKIFNNLGKLLNKFTAYTSLIYGGVSLDTADVDFDGVEDIIVFSSGI